MKVIDAARPMPISARPASDMLQDLIDGLDGERVTVGALFQALDGRAQGIVLLILALPMCVPNVPGISTLFGVLLIPPAIQMILRQKNLWMPGFMRRWTLKGTHLRAALGACAKCLRAFEHLAKPRISTLSEGGVLSFFGVQTLILSMILILPMPGTIPPSQDIPPNLANHYKIWYCGVS
jgi:hypothetical protein